MRRSGGIGHQRGYRPYGTRVRRGRPERNAERTEGEWAVEGLIAVAIVFTGLNTIDGWLAFKVRDEVRRFIDRDDRRRIA